MIGKVSFILLFILTQSQFLIADQIDTEEACIEQGGEWKPVGLLGNAMCVLTTGDAGKPCNDSSECESVCVVPEGKKPGPDTAYKGNCHDKNTQIGTCLARVVKGEVTPRLCLD